MSEFTSEEYEAEISKYVLLVNKHYNKRLDTEKKLKTIKKLIKEYKDTPSAYHAIRRSKIGQIWKILESSAVKEESD